MGKSNENNQSFFVFEMEHVGILSLFETRIDLVVSKYSIELCYKILKYFHVARNFYYATFLDTYSIQKKLAFIEFLEKNILIGLDSVFEF